MGLFKRFIQNNGDKAGALSFKNKLKYGSDIRAEYKAATDKSMEAYHEKEKITRKLEEIYDFQKRTTTDNWSSFNIAILRDCNKSPIGFCLYISYYGSKSPEKDDPKYCLCCKEKLF